MRLSLISITDEHNNWLLALDEKKHLIEKSATQLHFASERETNIITTGSLQSRVYSTTETIDRLWNEINDNLLDIARQAEETDGQMTEAMVQQHEKMKTRFLSADDSLQAFCAELSNISLN
ncbi:MAG: hypothetical protein EOP56_05025 [Sphingobacteriales bacterium]|nr:MAG: hypothetical protein EOP56_05025 [Sphingobacteriales bacterium]